MQVTQIRRFARQLPSQSRGEVRRDVLRKVLAERPLHFREIVRRSGIPAGTVRHHLSMLSRKGEASWQVVGSCLLWNLGAQPCSLPRAVEAIATPHQLEVLRVARSLLGQPQNVVIDALPHRGRSGVQHALGWWIQHGVLRYHLQGRYKLIQAC